MSALRWPITAAATVFAALAMASAACAELKVVVTIKPIHSLVTQLMEGIATPKLLIDGAASPHTFSLRPSGVRAVHNADVFIRVSDSLEPFTRKVVKAMPGSVELVTLVEAPGLSLLDARGDAHHHHADEGEDDDEEDARHAHVDGHIWLDPANAKVIVSYLADILIRRAPEHADKLRANAKRLNAKIDALIGEIAAEMAPFKHKPFIVFHDAYRYFQARFDLDDVGAITISPQVQPSAKRLIELRDKIRSLKVACVFAEPMFQPKLVAAVTEGLDVRTGTLDPDGSMLQPGGELYFKLMRDLAGELESCLGHPS